jgi:ADP-ribose pyrophosphatase YjhB (NUDIX family)
MKRAVASVIQNEKGRILLIQRGLSCRNEIGKWENLGGYLNAGENPCDGMLREAEEEIGVDLGIEKTLFITKDDDWITTVFLAHIISGIPRIREPNKIIAMKWYNLKEALLINLASYTKNDLLVLEKGLY